MRIGFDAKRAFNNKTGLGNYSRGIIDGIANNYPEHEIQLYTPKLSNNILYKPHLKINCPKGGLLSKWRSWDIYRDINADQIDIFHGLSNELPFSTHKIKAKTVVTIHDLIFLRYPELYPFIDRKIYNVKFRYAVQNADRIIAISEQTKRDIIHFYGIDAQKIDVVYQSAADIFTPNYCRDELQKVRKQYHLPSRFILNVGTVETRKNVGLAVKALANVSEDVHLVIVGRHQAYAASVKKLVTQHNLESRVHFLDQVAYLDLPLIYQLAELFVYPSKFEGFGIPIIEALQMRLPVIAATGSCLEEAGGSHSIYIHPEDADALAKALNDVLTNTDKARIMKEKGAEYVTRFAPEIIAEEILNVYQKTLIS